MGSCAEFLRNFSEYRDGYMGPAESGWMEAHLAGCESCGTYARVLEDGLGELKALPTITPSYDFLQRLQHRIYHLDEEQAWWRRGDTSGASLGFVLMLVVLIATAAWLPIARPKVPLFELPPVLAVAPQKPAEVHALFRSGPFLTPAGLVSAGPQPRSSSTAVNTIFFRYTPLGSYTGYQMEPAAPR